MAFSSPASCSKHTSPSRANAFNRSGPSLRKRFTRVQSPIRCPSSIEKVSALSATSQSRSLNRSATRERASATLSAFHVSSVSSPALTRPWASRRPLSSASPGWEHPAQANTSNPAAPNVAQPAFEAFILMRRCGRIRRRAQGPWGWPPRCGPGGSREAPPRCAATREPSH